MSQISKFDFDKGVIRAPIFPIMVRDNEKVYKIADMLQKKCILQAGLSIQP